MIKIISSLKIPDLITIINSLFGFGAILATYNGLYQFACILVLLAAIADGLDGSLARYIGGSDFGETLDSLADVISFGLAPAAMFSAYFKNDSIVLISMCFYLTCGILRLARFNVLKSKNLYFKGLPITASAITMACVLLTGKNYVTPLLISILGLLLAVLMISDINYMKIRDKKILLLLTLVSSFSIISYFINPVLTAKLTIPLIVAMMLYLISPIIKFLE